MGEVWGELSPARMFIGWPLSRKRGGNHREGRGESGASMRKVWKCMQVVRGRSGALDTGKRDGRVRASVIILCDPPPPPSPNLLSAV